MTVQYVVTLCVLIVAHLLLVAQETAGYVYSGSEDEGDPTVAGGTIRDSKEQLGMLISKYCSIYEIFALY